MRGIMLKVNEELYVLVGKVIAVQEEADKCIVALEYEEYEQGRNTTVQTEVVFWDQKARDDNKKPIPFANMVKRMKLTTGSTVMATVRFRDETHREANGYTCRYNGIISFPPDNHHARGRSVIGGTVTWMHDGIDTHGDIYITMGVYIGRDQYGQPQHVNISMKDEALIKRCRHMVTPQADGLRMNVVFRCGDAYHAKTLQGMRYTAYRAFDFTIKGSYSST